MEPSAVSRHFFYADKDLCNVFTLYCLLCYRSINLLIIAAVSFIASAKSIAMAREAL